MRQCKQELGRQNPVLLSVINNNQEEFLRLLNEPGAPGINQMAAQLASQFAAANDVGEGVLIPLHFSGFCSIVYRGDLCCKSCEIRAHQFNSVTNTFFTSFAWQVARRDFHT